jgi:spore germination cell wall hydrolase CwlJ-like protein
MKLSSLAMIIVITTASTTVALDARTETLMDDKNSKTITQYYTAESNPEEFCLAQNIYYESRTDNLAGMAAVADVVLNRVYDTRYPNDICSVVKQGPVSKWHKEQRGKEVPIKHRCQFSWYCDGKPDDQPKGVKWLVAQEIAYKMIQFDYLRGISDGATHYHATYVDPSWNKSMHLIGRIGLHIFYVSR